MEANAATVGRYVGAAVRSAARSLLRASGRLETWMVAHGVQAKSRS